MDINNIRKDYKKGKIDFSNIDQSPFSFFTKWFKDALLLNKPDVNSCVLSTVNHENTPFSRVVLLKDVNDKGFIFFTNYDSAKGQDINNNNKVAINFFWPELERQVRINGAASKVSDIISDKYFELRPRESQIAAWISSQSSSVSLDTDFGSIREIIAERFVNKDVSRPSYWGGYCVVPERVEFWQGRPSRLHDRLVYFRKGDNWIFERLSP